MTKRNNFLEETNIEFTKNKSSFFVVIEGVDGAGKTTLIEESKKFFDNDRDIKNAFNEIIYTREPGSLSLPFCSLMRKIVLEDEYKLENKTKAMLFFANRIEHVEKLIKPALKKEKTLVFCDRYYLSTLVYQGQNDPETMNWIKLTHQFITNVNPDVTFFIDISEEKFLDRYKKKSSKQEINSLDDYMLKNFSAVRETYRQSTVNNEKFTGDVVYINGIDAIEKKINTIKQEILKRI